MGFIVFMSGLVAGGGLVAAAIFATDAWYARRYPIMGVRQ